MTTLVTLSNQSRRTISRAELGAVAAALQIQIDRDFAPEWGKRAQVVALGPGDPVPALAWPLRVLDKPASGLGVHLDQNHRPFAEIEATDDWTVTASHELLEMLEDPFGQKFTSGPDLDPSAQPHHVRYLVEVADPCEMFSYTIGQITVSDFVTRDFYRPNTAAGSPTDFLGRLSGSFDVPAGGYISWIDPDDGAWHQKTPGGTFTRSREKADSRRSPREDRDHAFGPDDDGGRHALSEIRRRYPR